MSTETSDNPSSIEAYGEQTTDRERLDFLAYHLRVQTLKLERIEAMVNAVGQHTTNIDAFCAEVRAALAAAQKNPMARMMGMPPMQPPGKLIT